MSDPTPPQDGNHRPNASVNPELVVLLKREQLADPDVFVVTDTTEESADWLPRARAAKQAAMRGAAHDAGC